jgi:Spy/CpxP family protein refolding chaperone
MNKLMQEAARIKREKYHNLSIEEKLDRLNAENEIKAFLNKSPNNALSLSAKQHLEKTW